MFFIFARVLALYLDIICLIFLFAVSIFAVLEKDNQDPEFLAFILQSVTDTIIYFSVSIRMIAEIQNFMTSAQRI